MKVSLDATTRPSLFGWGLREMASTGLARLIIRRRFMINQPEQTR